MPILGLSIPRPKEHPLDQTRDPYEDLAALAWQVELGADEAICDAPINRFELEAKPKLTPIAQTPTPLAPTPTKETDVDAVAEAKSIAIKATSLTDLKSRLDTFDHCELKKGSRNTVFSDGNPSARVMIIGEAPGRDEDLQGKPFVGRAGQLLDKMLTAISLNRSNQDPQSSVYITNVLPWRPPQNRDPEPDEIAMLMPFVQRHVELADPDLIVLMGNIACQGILGRRGITRMRGNWATAFDLPVLPMFHPAYLLRNPAAKRQAWEDLLNLQAKLRTIT